MQSTILFGYTIYEEVVTMLGNKDYTDHENIFQFLYCYFVNSIVFNIGSGFVFSLPGGGI